MPLYEYECNKCKKAFDKVMSIKEMETVKITCPECDSEDVKKLMSSGRSKSGSVCYAGKVR